MAGRLGSFLVLGRYYNIPCNIPRYKTSLFNHNFWKLLGNIDFIFGRFFVMTVLKNTFSVIYCAELPQNWSLFAKVINPYKKF